MKVSPKLFLFLSSIREIAVAMHHHTPPGNCLKVIWHWSVKWKILLWGGWLINHMNTRALLPEGLYWAGEGLSEENLFLVWMRGWVCNMWQLEHGSSWLNTCRVYLNMTMWSVERLIQWTFIEHTQWGKPAFVAYTAIWSSLRFASCVQIVHGSPFLSSTK